MIWLNLTITMLSHELPVFNPFKYFTAFIALESHFDGWMAYSDSHKNPSEKRITGLWNNPGMLSRVSAAALLLITFYIFHINIRPELF